jgi:hypothetical protein
MTATDATAAATTATTGTQCQACHGAEVAIFFEADRVPVHGTLLLESREEALRFPRGDLRLGHCPRCGFIQNTAFDPGRLRYGAGYEDSQAHSPRFVSFADALARSLIERHELRDGYIVEVGSGQGDFLDLICRLGHNHGLAFDPATDPAHTPPTIDHRQVTFDESTRLDQLDLLVCRHTLEDIRDVDGFTRMLGGHLRRHPGAIGYVEVPDTHRILAEGAFWDLYYEHCSYFTAATLRAVVERAGLEALQVALGFDGQYIQLECTLGGDGTIRDSDDAATATVVAGYVRRFASRMTEIRDQWQTRFESWARSGKRAVLWGGGSKAVAFIATLELGADVDGVIDINPRKHGRYLPASGHAVRGPEALASDTPDVVVVMNPIYLTEIRTDLAARGLSPEVLAA